MLTEEAIKQTRFFKGLDENIYLVRDVRTVKNVTLINCEHGELVDINLGDEQCASFVPVTASFALALACCPEQEPPTVLESPDKRDPYARTEPSRTSSQNQKETKKAPLGSRKRRDSTSEFAGVRRAGNYRDGRPRYEASYKNEKGKKVYIGRSDNEFLAAAIYQEHIGNKQEAARLRALVAEDRELNPDKPLDGAARHEAKRAGKTIWVCKRCGLEYLSEGTCASCGNNYMQEVPA